MRPFFEAMSVSCVVPAQSPADDERTVFDNLSFGMERGDIIDLVGPSGSGKSSLLTACARLNPHAHGTFVLDGVGSDEFSAQQWRRDVSYLPQKPILTGKDVAEAIRLPWTLAIRGKGGKAARLLPDERIRTTLDAMGCEDIDLTRTPHDLSGGQAARVALARTLLTARKCCWPMRWTPDSTTTTHPKWPRSWRTRPHTAWRSSASDTVRRTDAPPAR